MKSFLALNLQVAEASAAEMHDMPIVAAAKAIASRQAINFSFDVCIGLAGPPLSCRVWTSADAGNHATKLRLAGSVRRPSSCAKTDGPALDNRAPFHVQ